MPLIADGVYKIRNVMYKDSVAGLLDEPNVPIVGMIENICNKNDQWVLVNVGNTGNQVTLESVSTPGYFANAESISANAELVGSVDKIIWNIIKVDRGYAIEAPDDYYVWKLFSDADLAPIKLVGPTAQDDTKWYFESVDNKRARRRVR